LFLALPDGQTTALDWLVEDRIRPISDLATSVLGAHAEENFPTEGILMRIFNNLSIELLRLGKTRVVSVDRDRVILPLVFSLIPARSDGPFCALVVRIFEDFVVFIVVVVRVVEVKHEFAVSIDSDTTVHRGFVWLGASQTQVFGMLSLFPCQVVYEYFLLCRPQIVPQVTFVLPV